MRSKEGLADIYLESSKVDDTVDVGMCSKDLL
jgi:hypothetical protein